MDTRFVKHPALAFALALTTLSCSDSAKICVPGAVIECGCPAGQTEGEQACNVEGTGYEECSCEGGVGANGGNGGGGASGTNSGGAPVGPGPGPGSGGGPGPGPGPGGGFGAAGGAGGSSGSCTFGGSCDPSLENECLCVGCAAECVDAEGAALSDCVCPSCAGDEFCVTNCDGDGTCDPFNEGCVCGDCEGHPECL